MKKNKLLVSLSVYLIKKIWHGSFGRNHNKHKNIICRFYPSCSNYAILALEKHGFFRGWFLAIKRIWRCTPNNTEKCVDYP
jgi:putative component of membrane protein insertase Oxa1/YidC/SpoIIIJ protein YidD